jgi:lysophospholipid acyltransferase (LPLAT)-like uncharacterized protein
MEKTTKWTTVKSWAWKLVLIVMLLVVGYVWLTLNWSYANGERAGYVQKFSERGWICKTWEGELAMINVPGTLTEKFLFTVPDDAIADKVKNLMGKRVSLVYNQHVGIPSSCFGDTPYFVVDVREVKE